MLIDELLDQIIKEVEVLPLDEKVETLNGIRSKLHEVSPFKSEPVDLVLWVKNEYIKPNEYNPNKVASPEMDLLKLSMLHDGVTQPVVSWKLPELFEVVDGFHRTKVCEEYEPMKTRLHGYTPLTVIKDDCTGVCDRVSSTIRHNRARGRHQVASMGDIVKELTQKGWDDDQITEHLGMTPEELLRLKQTVGTAKLLSCNDHAVAWEIEDD